MMCRPKPMSRAPVLRSRKLLSGDAADIALLADVGLQGIGVNLDLFVSLGDAEGRLPGRPWCPRVRKSQGQQQEQPGRQQSRIGHDASP